MPQYVQKLCFIETFTSFLFWNGVVSYTFYHHPTHRSMVLMQKSSRLGGFLVILPHFNQRFQYLCKHLGQFRRYAVHRDVVIVAYHIILTLDDANIHRILHKQLIR